MDNIDNIVPDLSAIIVYTVKVYNNYGKISETHVMVGNILNKSEIEGLNKFTIDVSDYVDKFKKWGIKI